MLGQRSKRRWVVPVLLILIFAVLAIMVVNSSVENQEDVIKIEKIGVTHYELEREIERCRAQVVSRIIAEYTVTDMTDFWKKRYDGQTPLEIIRKKALDTLSILKIEERLLRERNLWPYSHYSELLSDLEKTNKARMKAAKEGTTIYGPINYTERTFFDYQFGNAIIQLKEKLVKEGELVVDENALLSYFEKLKDTVYHKGELFEDYTRQVRDAYIEKIYARYIVKQKNNVDIILNEDRLNEYYRQQSSLQDER